MTVKLIQGDCLEEMQKLIDDDIKVDMVLTDPPYGTTACKWDSIIPLDKMWACLYGLINEDTPIVLFGSEPFSSNLRMSNINDFKYDWIWYKNTASGFPFAKYQPLRNHELISVFYQQQPNYNPIKEPRDVDEKNKSRYNYAFNDNKKTQVYGEITTKHKNPILNELSYPKTIKRFKSVPTSKGRLHPSQKPVDLLEYLIKTYTKEEDTVLDFTMGSGSTGVACVNTNRNFIGIELDENYYKIAQERINETKKQTKLM